MLHKRICEHCGKEFTAKKKNARFCSAICNMRFHARKVTNANGERAIAESEAYCMNCGKLFKIRARQNKFCSRECLDDYKLAHGGKEIICRTCGRIFVSTSNHRVNCSEVCTRVAKRYNCSPKLYEKICERLKKVRLAGHKFNFDDAKKIADDILEGTNNYVPREMTNLDKTIAEANALGMSYGKYVAMKRFGAIYQT